MKTRRFLLCVIGIAALTTLGLTCNMDVAAEISAIISVYIIGIAGQKGAMVYSASKDPACKTEDIIEKLK